MKDLPTQTGNNWFNRNPKKTTFMFVAGVSLIVLVAAEVLLRLGGDEPGLELPGKARVERIGDLEVYNSFLTDGEGVFKANKQYNWGDGIYGEGIRINSDGFRGIEFKRYGSNKKKILLLGDSFTWGASAKPIQNCFADLVSRDGYLVFNTGIPSVGPTQYAYLAEKYIPQLEPDVVAVMLYMGNDLYEQPYPMLPYHNLFYITNAGWFYGYDEKGKPLSLKEAFYHYYYPFYSYSILKNKFKYLFMSSVIGKKLWLLMNAVKHRQSENERISTSRNTRNCLGKIKGLCKKYGAEFMLFLIPVNPKTDSSMSRVKDNIHTLRGFRPFVPDFLTSDDYTDPPDNHFNNRAHLKFANFIIKTVQQGGK